MKTWLVACVGKFCGKSEDEGGQVMKAGIYLNQGAESGMLILRGD